MADYQWEEEGKRLKKIRLLLNKKPEDIAKLMGLVTNSYYQAEMGRSGFSMGLLKTMANHFNVSINYLLLGQGQMFLCDAQLLPDETPDQIDKEPSQKVEIPQEKDIMKMLLELQAKVDKLENK